MKRNKLLILFVVGLLMACAIFLGKKLLPADWETYTDTSAGFSIKYPRGWKIEKSSELKIRSEGIRIFRENKEFLPGIHIYFSPHALVEKEIVASNYQINPDFLHETKTKIGDNKVITIAFFDELPVLYHSIDHDGGSYIFIARGDEEEAVLQKMLPTLVFIK